MATGESRQIRDWLRGRIGTGMRLGLSTCSEMLDRLGNPHRDYPTIHVAGTNGKGSLCAHLSSLGASNGDTVGLFTSPHLITEEERTRIDGRPIDPAELDSLMEDVRLACESEPRIEPTYFEVTFLVEKAGIHKPGVPLVCLHSDDRSVRDSIESVAGPDVIWFHTDASDAQDVAREMSLEVGKMVGWDAREAPVHWSGRTNQPLVWSGVECYLSAAHNSESLAHDLSRISGREHVMVLGMTQKGDLSESVSPLADDSGRAHCIVTEVNGGRNPSVEPEDLASAIYSICDARPELVPDPSRAMDTATERAREMGCPVYVTGSVYLVGKVVEASLSRTDGDAWEYLTIHPPRAAPEG